MEGGKTVGRLYKKEMGSKKPPETIKVLAFQLKAAVPLGSLLGCGGLKELVFSFG